MVTVNIIPQKPCLVIQADKRYLVISDLHIGFENSLDINDIHLGKNITINQTIKEVESIISQTRTDSLILLGDVKSSIKSISKREWSDIPLFFEEITKNTDIILIPGNHDANIQKLISKDITVTSTQGLQIEKILLTHGHVTPTKNFADIDTIIMGHLHPVFFQQDSILNGQRVWIAIKTDKQDIFPTSTGELKITVMPSFNKYLYTSHKRYKKSISPIFQRIKKISSAKMISLDGTILKNQDDINEFF